MADQREVPARAQVARRRRVPPGHLPRVVAPAPAPVRLREAVVREAPLRQRPHARDALAAVARDDVGEAPVLRVARRDARDGRQAERLRVREPEPLRARVRGAPLGELAVQPVAHGVQAPQAPVPGRGDEQLQRPVRVAGRARDRAAALGRAVPAHHRGRAAEPVAPPAEPRRAVRRVQRPLLRVRPDGRDDDGVGARRPPGEAAGVERRDAADALLDVEERARLQVPDPELVAAGRDEDGRPRVARAPRLAAAAEAARRGGGAVVELEQDRVPPRVEELDPARAARDGHDVQRARRRDVRDAGAARDRRVGVHALPRAHVPELQPPVARPEQDLVHVRRRVAQDDARQVDVEAQDLVRHAAPRRGALVAPGPALDEARAGAEQEAADRLEACVEIKILRRVRAASSRRPPRHRRDACSTAWRCRFLADRPSQDGRVVAEK